MTVHHNEYTFQTHPAPCLCTPEQQVDSQPDDIAQFSSPPSPPTANAITMNRGVQRRDDVAHMVPPPLLGQPSLSVPPTAQLSDNVAHIVPFAHLASQMVQRRVPVAYMAPPPPPPPLASFPQFGPSFALP